LRQPTERSSVKLIFKSFSSLDPLCALTLNFELITLNSFKMSVLRTLINIFFFFSTKMTLLCSLNAFLLSLDFINFTDFLDFTNPSAGFVRHSLSRESGLTTSHYTAVSPQKDKPSNWLSQFSNQYIFKFSNRLSLFTDFQLKSRPIPRDRAAISSLEAKDFLLNYLLMFKQFISSCRPQ